MNATAHELLLRTGRQGKSRSTRRTAPRSSGPTPATSVLAPDSTTTSPTSDTGSSKSTSDRRSAAAVDVLRTWRLARELLRINYNDLVVVSPAEHEPPGLRVINADRSIDLILTYDGEVWMHRPWKQLIDHRMGATRSLGTTRLLAARVARAAHLVAATGPREASAPLAFVEQCVEFLEDHPRATIVNLGGWVPDGAGFRLDRGSSARWLRGSVPVREVTEGPLPELGPLAWFWVASDTSGRIRQWWSQAARLGR